MGSFLAIAVSSAFGMSLFIRWFRYLDPCLPYPISPNLIIFSLVFSYVCVVRKVFKGFCSARYL